METETQTKPDYPRCKWCKSRRIKKAGNYLRSENGKALKIQVYQCKTCGRTFHKENGD